MINKKYIVNFKNNDLKYLDSNIDFILNDIQNEKRRNDEFDFEIVSLFDGCVIDNTFSLIINTFVKDMMIDGTYYNIYYKKGQLTTITKEFIINLLDTKNRSVYYYDYDNYYQMEGFYYKSQHYILFFLPKELMSDDKYNEYLGLGPDFMIGQLNQNVIFKYFIPYLYLDLAEENLLDNNEFKDITKYKVGLH